MSATRRSDSARNHGEIAPMPSHDISNTESASVASTRRCITTASTLATDSRAFNAWADMVKLSSTIETNIPTGVHFEPIRNLQERTSMFPAWLKNPLSAEFRYLSPSHIYWRDYLCSEIQPGNGVYSDNGSDDPCLPNAVRNICQICHRLRA
ncbi:hypothetical protein V565_247170, partial [Rhizoctonia solani 123E]